MKYDISLTTFVYKYYLKKYLSLFVLLLLLNLQVPRHYTLQSIFFHEALKVHTQGYF